MQRVLLATDGSTHADHAAWLLSHLPHEDHLHITVLTVLQVPEVHFAYPTAGWISECLEREREDALSAFSKIEEMFEGANVTLEHCLKEGHRARQIVDLAEKRGVDLIVLGARGRSAVDRILLGSVSDYVATQAPCSVLVVRESDTRQTKRPLKVTIAYEATGPARAALEEFGEFGWGPNVSVDVVTVVSPPPHFLGETFADLEASLEQAKRDGEEAVTAVVPVAPAARSLVIQNQHVGDGLVRHLETQEADLVVVGETKRHLLGRVLLGSVSLFVLRHAPCSVWITRNRIIRGAAKKDTADAAVPADN